MHAYTQGPPAQWTLPPLRPAMAGAVVCTDRDRTISLPPQEVTWSDVGVVTQKGSQSHSDSDDRLCRSIDPHPKAGWIQWMVHSASGLATLDPDLPVHRSVCPSTTGTPLTGPGLAAVHGLRRSTSPRLPTHPCSLLDRQSKSSHISVFSVSMFVLQKNNGDHSKRFPLGALSQPVLRENS